MITLTINKQNYSFLGNEFWVSNIARIMQLEEKKVRNSAKILFCKNPGSLIKKYYPVKYGWVKQDNRLVSYYSHNTIKDIFVDIGKKSTLQNEYMKIKHSFYPVFEREILKDGFPLHSGLVTGGVLFAGSSGSGKSTCCKKSLQKTLADDTSLIVSRDNHYYVHPWVSWGDYIQRNMNTTFNVQNSVPLRAIFLIEKAAKTEILEIKKVEVIKKLFDLSFERIYLNVKNMKKTDRIKINTKLFDNICNMVHFIPVYKLGVSLKGDLQEAIERVI